MYGLSLSSGGIRGIAFLPFLEFLQNYSFNAYGGTSIGSFFASYLAFEKEIREIKKKLKQVSIAKLFHLRKPFLNLDYLLNFAFSNEKLREARKDLIIVASLVKEELKPYYFTSFEHGKNFRVKQALKASMAVPFLVGPYKIKNKAFVDGALVEPFPLFKFKETKIKKLLILDVNTSSKDHFSLHYSFISFLSSLLMKQFKKRSKIKTLWVRIYFPKTKLNFLSYYKVGLKALKENKKKIEKFLD